jgi:hypothetical protein
MTGWLEYDYLIASQPNECACPSLNRQITCRIEMKPRGQWLNIAEADALLIVMDGAKGLGLTSHSDLFSFVGNRPNFDGWMSANHPQIDYEWIDQYAAAFADRAAQLSLNDDLGQRVLRAKHLPRTV